MRSAARCVCVFVLLLSTTAGAGEHRIDYDTFIDELQHISSDDDAVTLVWWVPEEFWRFMIDDDPEIKAEDIVPVIKALRPYTVILAVDGTIGELGGTRYRPESEVRKTLRIRDVAGSLHSPLADDKVAADAKVVMGMMKPMFISMFGPMGKNLNAYFFPAGTKAGRLVPSPAGKGTFAVVVGEQEFRYRLPLESTQPPQVCPKCKATLRPVFRYCPWDGTKLPERAATK